MRRKKHGDALLIVFALLYKNDEVYGRIPALNRGKPFLFRGKNGNHRVHETSLCYIRINIAKSSDNPLKP